MFSLPGSWQAVSRRSCWAPLPDDMRRSGDFTLRIPSFKEPKPRDGAAVAKDFLCAVCYEFPPSADEVRITPCCHHVFCADCIVKAVEDAGFCPLDRKGLNCDDLKELDGLSKRIFESVPVVCSRDGCNWEGSLGRFWNHAEDCSYASSVSAMSKVEVAKTLHEVERKHRTFRERVVRTHHYNKAIFLKCCEESERHKNRHILLKQDLEKLETKVTNLEKEKEELTAKLDAWESNWSHRLRKKGRA